MTDAALPVLVENGSRLDWTDADYRLDMRVGDGYARVTHQLDRAPSLERLIEDGHAVWAVELRSPKTLLSRIHTSAVREMEVRWDQGEVDGLIYLLPGLIATADVQLDGQGLDDIWSAALLDIPAGWWLVRGNVRRIGTLREALLTFEEDGSLPPGAMKVAPDASEGRLRFVVSVASDIRPVVEHDRSMQVAGLVGACALFPAVFGPDVEEEHSALVGEIRDRLEAADVPDWNDPENYDPARVATVIEPFLVAASAVEADDE